MKKLCVLIFIIIITLVSCDGRDRKYKTNAEVLKENKLFDSFSEEIKYIPAQRTEVLTDTILSTGFQVKIQYYALDNDYSSKTVKPSNKINKILHFKNFEAHFQISKNKKLVTQNIINKELFKKFGSPAFWEQAIMQYVWIDYENSTEDFIVLNTSFNIPETEIYKDFSIAINAFGNIKISQINLVENLL
ncbi:DUF4738 domain-containing protein [Wocania ichthyoenteri]|uniref:DUF4738 domain-containing protein n=1 Tax=Wocania ichthyoenteri TaxID=1230531 RepID=UPI00053DBFAC|nr:DUF4738 domain-containing protein [Wocania ichthyoenteri]